MVEQTAAQITITSADMPVSGDSLRYTIVSPLGTTIDLADTGTARSWTFDFTPTAQAVDNYRSALSVSPFYALISLSAYGYKVADSIPGLSGVLPVSITEIYNFFEKTSGKYSAVAFAAKIAGLPTPANYTADDIWYRFPLNYGDNDSNNYAVTFSLASVGSMKQQGYRKSRVDAWGTITTPYYTTPVNCIRVRSEIHEIDTVTFGSTKFGIPRNTVEYKWLVNGDHYPALWVTTNVIGGTEAVSNIRYRDSYFQFPLDVQHEHTASAGRIMAQSNPVLNNELVLLNIPTDWHSYSVSIYDVQSRNVATVRDQSKVDVSHLPHGTYIACIQSGYQFEFVRFVN